MWSHVSNMLKVNDDRIIYSNSRDGCKKINVKTIQFGGVFLTDSRYCCLSLLHYIKIKNKKFEDRKMRF